MKILVLNSGSSSVKSCVYEIGGALPEDPPAPIWKAKIEKSDGGAVLHVSNPQGMVLDTVKAASTREALVEALNTLRTKQHALASHPDIDVIGHRVVQGGQKYQEPVVITAQVTATIAQLSEFAPLHNREELEGVEAAGQIFRDVPQVAVFDTAFHKTLPLTAAMYPGPYQWFEQGIRKYGFHGINHQYCAERAAEMLGRDLTSLKLVTCHLGSGCSLAAISSGRSIDTTMGFTPLEGLMMGTRSGSIDPGILTYLMGQRQITAAQMDELLNQRSGLLGISGVSGDMREIRAAMEGGHARAKLAFEMYAHRLQSYIGAMIAVLGGIDALVFSAGVGENFPEVRAAACQHFAFAGLALDPKKNLQTASDTDISAPASKVRVLVVHAQEEWCIARSCWKICGAKTA